MLRTWRPALFAILIAFAGIVLAQGEKGKQAEQVLSGIESSRRPDDGAVEETLQIMEEIAADTDVVLDVRRQVMEQLVKAYQDRGTLQQNIDLLTQAIDEGGLSFDQLADRYEFRGRLKRAFGDRDGGREDFRIATEYRERIREEESPQNGRIRMPGQRLMHLFPRPASFSAGTAGLSLLAFTLLMYLLNLRRGRRQSREGKGSRQRLRTVVGVVTLAQILPLLVWWAMLVFQAGDLALSNSFRAALICLVWNAILTYRVLGPPLRWLGRDEPLPEVHDEEFLTRYRDLCGRMNLTPPTVRMVPSLSGSMEIQAWAGGIVAPSLTVTDGVIHRLEKEEATAILGHELGHIANGSLWWLGLVWIIPGPVLAVLVAPQTGIFNALVLGLTLGYGLAIIVSRYFEIDCDLQAGRAAGFGTMAAGLEKVHKGLPYEMKGWRSVLAMSMATHPLFDVRIGALAAHASPADPVRANWSPNRQRASQVFSTLVLLLWSGLLIWAIREVCLSQESYAAVIALVVTFIVPGILIQGTVKKSVKQEIERRSAEQTRGKVSPWVLWPLLIVSGGLMAYLTSQNRGVYQTDLPFDEPYLVLLIAIPLFLIVFIMAVIQRRVAKLNLQVLQALQEHRWEEAIRLGELKPKTVARNVYLQHNVALAKWFVGREQEAIADLAAIEEKNPKLRQTYLTRGNMLLEHGDMDAVFEEVGKFVKVSPLDFEAYYLSARAFFARGEYDKTLGQLEEAEKALKDQAGTFALRAAVAAHQGDLEKSAMLFDRAEDIAPSLPLVRYLAAEVTVNFGPVDAAREAIDNASRLIHAAPLSMLQHQLERLVQVLEKRSHSERSDDQQSGSS